MTVTEQQLDHLMDAALRAERYDEFERLLTQAEKLAAEREARLAAPEALAAAASWYATQGLPVFPLQPRDKKPFPGSRGFKDATTDAGQIASWWTANPDANIGLPTGGLFDVVDIDGEQGALSYRRILTEDMLPTVYGRATTARARGRHLYIRPTGDGNGASIMPGIDYRGLGGYVVAPPSITTRRYDWYVPLDIAALKAAA